MSMVTDIANIRSSRKRFKNNYYKHDIDFKGKTEKEPNKNSRMK